MVPLPVFLLVVTFLGSHRASCLGLISLHLSYLGVLENMHRLLILQILELALLMLGCHEAERLVHLLEYVEVVVYLFNLGLFETASPLFSLRRLLHGSRGGKRGRSWG